MHDARVTRRKRETRAGRADALAAGGGTGRVPVDISRIEPGSLDTSDVVGLVDLARAAIALVPDDPREPVLSLAWSGDVTPCALLWLGFGGDRQPPWYGTARLLAVEPMSLLPWDDPEKLPCMEPGEVAEYAIRVTLEAPSIP